MVTAEILTTQTAALPLANTPIVDAPEATMYRVYVPELVNPSKYVPY